MVICYFGIILIGLGDGFRIGGLLYVLSNKVVYVGSIGYYNNLIIVVIVLFLRVDANSSYIIFIGVIILLGNMNIY